LEISQYFDHLSLKNKLIKKLTEIYMGKVNALYFIFPKIMEKQNPSSLTTASSLFLTLEPRLKIKQSILS